MIQNEENFNAHPPAGFDGVFHWDVFGEEGCWGETKIKPMDFDGVVERKSHYLVFETKDNGKSEPPAQTWALDRLRQPKTFTVVRIWPKAPPFKHMEITYHNGITVHVEGHAKIIEKVGAWFKWADSDSDSGQSMCSICGSRKDIIFANGKWQCDLCYSANKGWGSSA